jgi:hypothetical protein
MNIEFDKSDWRQVIFGEEVQHVAELVAPNPIDSKLYIGLEHMDRMTDEVSRWGTDIELIGTKLKIGKGDVLLARRNPYLRRVQRSPHKGIFSAHGMVLRSKSHHLLQEFLLRFMQSNYFWDEIDRIAVGSLSKTINWGDIAKFNFLIPSIDQQKEIIMLFSKIEKTHKSYIEFDLQLKVTWRNLEEMLFKNSNAQHTFGALAEINPPSTSTKGLTESFLYIDISSINGEREIEIDKLQRFCFPDAPSRAQRLVIPGDILVSTVRPLQKSITVVPQTDQVFVTSSGVAVLKPKNNSSRNMINAIIYGDYFTQSMQSKSTGSSYPAIKPRDIQEFKIPDPTALQNINIVNQIVSVMEMITVLRQEISELMNLKNALLREIFQGTVKVGKKNA